ncbi:hypothetical protein DL96DRAFT_533874 [Flagelloscypha sp. PMI_526]|nr:hypothetical protein DL96DRAFT_533874 [Flagelloscypha sp. PMI_526]
MLQPDPQGFTTGQPLQGVARPENRTVRSGHDFAASNVKLEDNPPDTNFHIDKPDFPTFRHEIQSKSLDVGWPRSALEKIIAPGRSSLEGRNWWNPKVRELYSRPGSGTLASLLPGIGDIVDQELFSVKIVVPTAMSNPQPLSRSHSLPRSRSLSHLHGLPRHSPPPLDEELRVAIPHPDAYYSPKHNSWILLSWGKSKQPPPLIPFYPQQDVLNAIFRREERCAFLDCNDLLQLSHTHHFHKFPSAVDPKLLDSPYEPGNSVSPTLPLDLYVCCRCQLHLIASSFSQPLVPQPLWNAFLEERRALSSPKTTPETMIVAGLKLLHTAIQNKLWGGEDGLLKSKSLSFKRHLGIFTPTTKRFFEFLGFSLHRIGDFEALMPAPTDVTSPEGLQNRAQFLRIWVELGAFLTYFIAQNGQSVLRTLLLFIILGVLEQTVHLTTAAVESGAPFWVRLTEYAGTESVLALHPFHTTSIQATALDDLPRNLVMLGVNPAYYSPTLLIFAYRAQCHCDPINSVEYFSTLCEVEAQLQANDYDSSILWTFIAEERSFGSFTRDDLHNAVFDLGLSFDLHLFLGTSGSSPTSASDFVSRLIYSAWKATYKKIALLSESEANNYAKHANEALRILSQVQGSEWLHNLWLKWKDRPVMTLNKAYDTLGAQPSSEDEVINNLYRSQLHESRQFWRRYALIVLSESRASSSLKDTAEGSDANGNSQLPLYEIILGHTTLKTADLSFLSQFQVSQLVNDLESALPLLKQSRIRRRLLRLIRMLSSQHDVLPVSLQLHDLQVSEHPFSGGGFSVCIILLAMSRFLLSLLPF